VLRGFLTEAISITALILAALIIVATSNNGAVALFLLLCTSALLGWSFYQASSFWEYSIAEDLEE